MVSPDKSEAKINDRVTEDGSVSVHPNVLPSACCNVIDGGSGEHKENDKTAKEIDHTEYNQCDASVSLAFPPQPSNKVVIPKYVVRPGPVAPAPKYVLTETGMHHMLDRIIWLNVFSFLTKQELACCMQVCKTWNRWCLDSYFWRKIDLRSRVIRQNHLIGVVRRQPRELDLQDAVINKKQLMWLIARLPHLKVMNLRNNTWAAVNALCSSACPLLEKLDLSWVNGIWDDCIRDLVSPPTDHRPGVDESISRLHRCTELRLTGTDIADQALEIIGTYMPHLTRLDISYCSSVTDKGLEYLSDEGAVTKASIVELMLSYVIQLSDSCFDSLAAFTKIQTIDLSHCPNISASSCTKFLEHSKSRKYIISDDLKISVQFE
ncbi:hypothetical protein LSH36_997g02055 [Paralvinella palmiformis]|uniref:F-box domain-containing protein n=1 Tax=Paralvinella palmiformis TaxID=53620 RepID=A0AAD9IW87_9ANNE|nr:hypothetical protein LSH36_997g02055 [Paralvinella palmiformis]